MDEQIATIINEGQKVLISEEPVLGGFTRPLVFHYIADAGTVVEEWTYPPDSAMTKSWGAIEGVKQYILHMTTAREKILLRLSRCKELKLRYLEENTTITVSPEDSLQLLQAFSGLIGLLDVGEARMALGLVAQMPDAYFAATEGYETDAERKNSYIVELQGIVTDLFDPI
jgi:hypothetical protein